MTPPELFVGITSFNSEPFLGLCLESLRRTTGGIPVRTVVIDNASADASAAMARDAGAEVIVKRCSQGEALSRLLELSQAPHTLLIHSDVVFLSPAWFALCRGKLGPRTALVSPADGGLGPFTRNFWDRPESSFLFFDTRAARALRQWHWRRRFRLRFPIRRFNFFGPHVTHQIPDDLRRAGWNWTAMDVYTSPRTDPPIYRCDFDASNWKPEYARYVYGFGNFYGIDGEITHYHNWYDRVEKVRADSPRVHPTDGLPLAFLGVYGENFRRDFRNDAVRLPGAAERGGAPR